MPPFFDASQIRRIVQSAGALLWLLPVWMYPNLAAAEMLPQALEADCLLVDSDGNLDDLRAVAIVAAKRHIAAIVATGGLVPVDDGVTTFARFFRGAGGSGGTKVIRGRSAAAEPGFTWLAEARQDAKEVQAALPEEPVPVEGTATPVTTESLKEAVANAVQGCGSVGLLMIGPWTSFVVYREVIRPRLKFVVAQGRSPFDPADPDWDRVNCTFDTAACRDALVSLQDLSIRWVDLPAAGPLYPLDEVMIAGLGGTEMSRTLRRVMQMTSSWQRQQLWDDTAAIYLERPGAFRTAGGHFEPDCSPAEMRRLASEIMNGSADIPRAR